MTGYRNNVIPSFNYAIWPQALEMGKIAGANAAGEALTYEQLPAALTFEGMNTSLFAAGDNGVQLIAYYTPESFIVDLDGDNAPHAQYSWDSPLCIRQSKIRRRRIIIVFKGLAEIIIITVAQAFCNIFDL